VIGANKIAFFSFQVIKKSFHDLKNVGNIIVEVFFVPIKEVREVKKKS
jgi:hypothetical protein